MEKSHYDMNHPKRGMAVIFNHEFFSNRGRRAGTLQDSNGLKRVLTSLGFNVLVFHDLNLNVLLTRLNQVAAMDHSDKDCLVVAVLTHGDLGWLCARDTEYKSKMLWNAFSPKACPTLIGKPKVFFIQACRGDKLDSGVQLYSQRDGTSSGGDEICTDPDFLIARSTVPGYYSFRNTLTGSCFIQALIEELENHQGDHLLSLLTVVNRRVAFDFESNNARNTMFHQKKAIPSIDSTLTRLLTFDHVNKH